MEKETLPYGAGAIKDRHNLSEVLFANTYQKPKNMHFLWF